MSMTDPIADMLTRIRNAQTAAKTQASMPASKLKVAIARVLRDEGYITDFSVADNEAGHPELTVALKYFEGRPVIDKIERVSRPSRRVFRGKPSGVSRQGRSAQGDERLGRGDRFHAAGADERPRGAGGRPRRRSAVHRGLRERRHGNRTERNQNSHLARR